jgi:DNA primase
MTSGSHAIPSDEREPHRLLIDDLDVVEVLKSAGVQFLAQSGDEHQAKCPFHADDIVSFRASRKTGQWRCLGCGRSGTVVDFLVEYWDEPFGRVIMRLTGDSDDQA